MRRLTRALKSQSIGSKAWKFRNYGPGCTIRSIILAVAARRRNALPIFSDLGAALAHLGIIVSSEEVNSSFLRVDILLQQMRDSAHNQGVVMKDVIGLDKSRQRLYAIHVVLSQFRESSYFETGTQHAVSIAIADDLVRKSTCGFATSVDVESHHYAPENWRSLRLVVLRKPMRKQLEALLRLQSPGSVFFHDSDHSAENMFFEFETALKSKRFSIIMSDDADANVAFELFCSRNDLSAVLFSFDGGPAVGIARV